MSWAKFDGTTPTPDMMRRVATAAGSGQEAVDAKFLQMLEQLTLLDKGRE